jgi:hypothetical protein
MRCFSINNKAGDKSLKKTVLFFPNMIFPTETQVFYSFVQYERGFISVLRCLFYNKAFSQRLKGFFFFWGKAYQKIFLRKQPKQK